MRNRQAKKIRGRAATSKNQPYRMNTFRRAMRKLRLHIVSFRKPFVFKEMSWLPLPADSSAVNGYDKGKGDDQTVFTLHRACELFAITKKDMDEILVIAAEQDRVRLQRGIDELNRTIFQDLLQQASSPFYSNDGAAEGSKATTTSVGTLEDIRKDLFDFVKTHEPRVTHMLFMTSVYKKLKDQIEVRPHIDRGWNVIDSVYGIAVEVFDCYEKLRQRAWRLKMDGYKVKIFEE